MFIEIPLTNDFVGVVDELKSRKKKGTRLAISKKKDRARVEIRLSPGYRENLKVLEDILTFMKSQGENKTTVTFIVGFKYDTDKYETDPDLPVEYPEESGRTKKVLLTGVKLNFADPASNLKYTIIDLEYCLSCGEYHTISNQVVCREDIAVNGHLLLNAIKTARKYSEAFVKRKRKRK
ncbi:MAG: hypothetical protein HQ583_05340 [Candidatus Abyssubacteria bacterium]|nr:hypothetical protein [Candidatus Abyssubacteria bacterium]